MTKPTIPVPDPTRQLAFHELLVAARKTWLVDALNAALREVDAVTLVDQLRKYVPPDAHVILATSGIPDEQVFPVPVLLEAEPTLLAYYRLLLGLPQKTFYGSGSGMGLFKSMEKGSFSKRQHSKLPDFCQVMCSAMADLISQMSPQISPRDVAELPILTLGQQFQGGNNNTIGKQATTGVFLAIRELVEDYATKSTERQITVKNSAGEVFLITLSSDPDVRIQKQTTRTLSNEIAIEIKGGADTSNEHNRTGEAEKSHLKAKGQGYKDFWTIIRTKQMNMTVAKIESPTTRLWFDTAQVGGREGTDWHRFRREIASTLGIPLDEDA